ncbi:hypothetical protein [Nonomuraea sediminis]|uniref:hypothetical protein n=1 Tax=Nonomuraea sediminis TaxID=2835864 RepID=UPI001BDC9113|nr:hypothetical protein [Nonomuraea sediminis]
MNRIARKIALSAALVGALATVAPAASASAAATIAKCSNWKLVGNRYFQSCIDVTATQVSTYGLVSSAGTTAASDTGVGLISYDEGTNTLLGNKQGAVHVDNDTVRYEGYTAPAVAGRTIRSTVYVPGLIGTGTLVGTDGARFCEPILTGPIGPDGKRECIEEITVWASVTS